jgi:hypothetical protein
VVSSPRSRTRNHRAEPSCVAQHGTCFILDEPPRVLGCVVHALRSAPRTVVSGSSLRLPPCSTPGGIHSSPRTSLLLSQPVLDAPGRCPVWHKPLGCSNGHHTPLPHPLGWLQFRREVRVSTQPFFQHCFGAWGYCEVFVEQSLGVPVR